MFVFYITFYIIILELLSIFIPVKENFKDNYDWIRYSIFTISSIVFVLSISKYKNNSSLLVLLMLIYLTFLKFCGMTQILNNEYFYIVVYPLFYIILFYSSILFFEKISNINHLKIF